jgi:hypothetical protein
MDFFDHPVMKGHPLTRPRHNAFLVYREGGWWLSTVDPELPSPMLFTKRSELDEVLAANHLLPLFEEDGPAEEVMVIGQLGDDDQEAVKAYLARLFDLDQYAILVLPCPLDQIEIQVNRARTKWNGWAKVRTYVYASYQIDWTWLKANT